MKQGELDFLKQMDLFVNVKSCGVYFLFVFIFFFLVGGEKPESNVFKRVLFFKNIVLGFFSLTPTNIAKILIKIIQILGKKPLWAQSSFCSGLISRIQTNLRPDFFRP